MNYRSNNNAGELKHRITFLNPPGKDEDGFPIIDWTDYVTVWAAIKTLKGKAFYEAAADQLQDVKQIGIRYRKDVDDNMRIRHKDKIYKIISMTNDDENNQWWTIHVRETRDGAVDGL
ncbi:phage head closure protein [Viridibacillus sp. FSL H8-0110]|uniref:phage head closure protein n=1 Tax=Viridibacillus sp. FSL H8-0110 TaxID=2921376 RepID=UPI0030F6A205